MQLQVTEEAIRVFRQDWGFVEGDTIRIFASYVGGGSEPYALRISKDQPKQPSIRAEVERMQFFIEESDLWVLDGRSLTIDAKGDEIQFSVGESK